MPATELRDWVRSAWADTEPTLRAFAEFKLIPQDASPDGVLSNIPIAVKDVIDVAGLQTRAGSRARESVAPAIHDAEVVRLLKSHGACMAGKTMTTEFAYLDATETTNPFNQAHTPGGSSSGSAAAVGAGVVPLALGTQTAGSVCRPAAFCGTFAFKPSTGSSSPNGVTPFAPSFDTVGVMGLSLPLVCKAALLMIGESPVADDDSRATNDAVIGLIQDDYFLDVSRDCREVLEQARATLCKAGYRLESLKLGLNFEELRSVHRSIMQFEAYQNHGQLLSSHADQLGEHWANALSIGATITSEQYEQAQKTIAAARCTILAAIEGVDMLLLPPTRSSAPSGIGATGDAGLIIPWTYTGNPLVVLPVGLDENGLPLAVMLAGKPGKDLEAAGIAMKISQVLASAGLVIDR